MTGAAAARAGAIAIAVAAAIDPSFTRESEVPVPLRVVHRTHPSVVGTLQRALGDRFVLGDDALADAAAWLVLLNAGDPLPRVPGNVRIFTMAMERDRDLYVKRVAHPADVLKGQKTSVVARLGARGVKGQTLKATLFAGSRVASRAEHRVAADDGDVEMTLTFVPESAGLLPLRIEIESGLSKRTAETALRVTGRRLHVRFEDARPSWMSTFVRRALESNPLFDVSSSVSTSRGLASESGQAPPSDDSVDAMVLGSPSSASPALVARFERFVRERGGAGFLLADEDSSAMLARLTGVGPWTRRKMPEPVRVASTDSTTTLRAADALVAPPTAYSRPIATLPAGEIAIHDVAAGTGRIVASGAIDAWRYRADAQHSFAAFWQETIAAGAAAAISPISLSMPASARPGSTVLVEAALRDDAGAVTGTVRTDAGEMPLHFVRSADPRIFHARFEPPSEGRAWVRVSSTRAGTTLEAARDLLVARQAFIPPASPVQSAALAPSHNGAHIDDGSLETVREALEAAFPSHTAPVEIRPMRYAWWLAPFTLLLGYEWRWRRRHGLR